MLFGLGWLVLTWPWISGEVTIPWDAKAHFEPQLVFLARALHTGDSPFWTPNVFAGHPQIADPQSLIFSPPFLLLALLDPRPGFRLADATVFLTLYVGGVAVMLLFRDRNWHPLGALVAAFSFAFGASAAWRIQHIGEVVSLAWFPMALWLLSRALARASPRYGFAAGLVAGFMVLGRDQVAYLATLTLIGFVVWRVASATKPLDAIRTGVKPIVAGLIGGLLVTGLPLALTFSLSRESNRAVIDLAGAERGSLHPASLFTVLVPNLFGTDGPLAKFWGPPSSAWGPTDLFLARNMGDVYIGALPFVALVAIGVVRGGLVAYGIRFFTTTFALVLLYALGRYTPAFRLMYMMPGVDLFRRPADATFILGALGAILSGFCVHRLSTAGAPQLDRAHVALAGLVIAAMFAAAAVLAISTVTFADARAALTQSVGWALCAALSLALARRLTATNTLAAMALVALVMTLDLRANNGPNESTALPPQIYDVLRPDSANETIALLKARLAATAAPDRRDRVELAAIGFHWPNASLVHDLDHDLGYNPVRLKLFTDATGAGDHVALAEQRQFSPLFPSYRSPMADLIGLRFIATGVPAEEIDKRLHPGDLTLIARTVDAYVYENSRALPRVLFATNAVRADFDALIKTGAWPNIDFAHTVLLEHPSIESLHSVQEEPSTVKAELVSYGNTEITVEARSSTGGYVVLNDVWHPWWFAEVDGKPAPLLRANVMFRAVQVPPGVHGVRFIFRPLAGLLAQWRTATQLATPAAR